MAEFYLDISTIGNEYQAYADTPTTWAVPQDGNGKAASAASSAVPVAEVTFAAIPTTGAISVFGVTITLTGVLSAASTAAAATALASSINASTGATGTAVSALLLPINRFVYARVKPGGGANDSIVQIMSRFAGSDLNYGGGANTSARVTNTFNNTAMTSPVDFAGGTDGPWAYIVNVSTVFGKSQGAYGLWFAATPTPASPGASDLVHVRSGRSSAGLSINYSSASAFSLTWKQRNYLYDNGVVWSGAANNNTLTIDFVNAASSSVWCDMAVSSGETVSHVGAEDDKLLLRGAIQSSGSGLLYFFVLSSGSKAVFSRCTFGDGPLQQTGINPDNLALFSDVSSSYAIQIGDASDSKSVFTSTAKRVIQSSSSYGGSGTNDLGHRWKMNGHRCTVTAATGAIGHVAAFSGANQFNSFEWIGGEIKDSNGVYRCTNPVSVNATNLTNVLIDGVVGVTDPSIGFTASATHAGMLVWNQPEGPNKGFRLETPQFSVDWKGDGTFPYAGAAADLRGVNWSHRVSWNSAPSSAMSVSPLTLRHFFRGTAAAKTITVDMYVPNAVTFYDDEIELIVSYLDSTDVWRTEKAAVNRSRQLTASRTAISSGSATWTPNGVASYSAKEMSLTTAFSVKSSSEIIARINLCAPRSPTSVFYVSPELVLT